MWLHSNHNYSWVGFFFSFSYQGRKVAFYKRAQILVADTWSVLEGKGDGCFNDISRISVFADYRIPQVLVHLGAMRYSEELMNKLKKGIILFMIMKNFCFTCHFIPVVFWCMATEINIGKLSYLFPENTIDNCLHSWQSTVLHRYLRVSPNYLLLSIQ